MKLLLPCKKTAYGPITDKAYFMKVMRQYGQFFGEDLSGPACNYNPSYPCNQTLYQYMGWGPHQGLDIPCATGTEIYASHDGFVQKTSETVSQGIGIVIRLEQQAETVYWHHEKNLVKVGDQVKAGQLIAISDTSGFANGAHEHWEYKPWNGNAYKAVDPIPYLTFNDTMTNAEVRDLYRLAFYREPDTGELSFWTGKQLSEFLKIAIKDRADFLIKP